MDAKIRIKELITVKAGELRDNEGNWRLHPGIQRRALEDAVEQFGITDVLKVYDSERHGGLTLIDGHLRKDAFPDVEWPALLLDVTDEEADLIMASGDAIASLAEASAEKLIELRKIIEPTGGNLRSVLDNLCDKAAVALMRMKATGAVEPAKLVSSTVASGTDGLPVEELPLTALVPNDYGPRAMTEKEYAGLLRSVKANGVLQALVVRPLQDGLFEIVDGRQRFKAAMEAGLAVVPVRVRQFSEPEAKVASIALNRLSGEVITSKMTETLLDVRSKLGDENVSRATGMDKVVMDAYTDKLSFNVSHDEHGIPQREYKEYTADDLDGIGGIITLFIPVQEKDYDLVKDVLSSISTNWADAIVELAEYYKEGVGNG
jgi:hypothetical protein